MSTVEHIFIAPKKGAPMVSLREVEALADCGLRGDRNATVSAAKSPGSQLTLIEREQIVAFSEATGLPLAPGEPRRNLVTTGVRLNDLCGKRFRVGDVQVEGVMLCEPCGTFESRTHPGIVRFFTHKGGLRARIIRGGVIRVGDSIPLGDSDRVSTAR